MARAAANFCYKYFFYYGRPFNWIIDPPPHWPAPPHVQWRKDVCSGDKWAFAGQNGSCGHRAGAHRPRKGGIIGRRWLETADIVSATVVRVCLQVTPPLYDVGLFASPAPHRTPKAVQPRYDTHSVLCVCLCDHPLHLVRTDTEDASEPEMFRVDDEDGDDKTG